MTNKSKTPSIAATIVAAILGVVGLYLPWVQQLPAGYTDGQPYYTMEYVTGLDAGIRGSDPLVMLLLVAVVAVVLLARYQNWRPDIALVGAGALMLWMYGSTFRDYWSEELYAVEPGLYLLLASGLLLLLIGAGGMFKRHGPTSAGDSRGPQFG